MRYQKQSYRNWSLSWGLPRRKLSNVQRFLKVYQTLLFFLSKEKWKENSKCLLRKQKTNWLDNAKHNFDCCIHGQDVYNPLPSCHGCRGEKKFVAHSKFRPVWVMHGQSFGVFSAFTFYNLIAVHVTSIQIENNNIILIHIPGILLVHTM